VSGNAVKMVRVLGSRYRLVAEVGAGGMSTVWRAVDEVLRREVAVKVLAPDADATVNHRLRYEARAVAKLTHPYIVPVFDYGEFVDEHDQRSAYVVMELVRGESLSAHLRNEVSLPWRIVRISSMSLARRSDC